MTFSKSFTFRFGSVSNNQIRKISHSHTQVEWFSVFPDVSLHSDYSHKVTSKNTRRYQSVKFPRNGGSRSNQARQLFPCQTRASEASEFDEEKSGVLLLGTGSCPRVRSPCVSDVYLASRSVHSLLGLLVTPQERFKLKHDTV
jgi:hypothetical protein